MARHSLVSFFSLGLCLLLLCHASLGQLPQYGGEGQQRQPHEQRRLRWQGECRLENLNALEPKRRVESEAGVTEYWDENDQQFECAGVAATRLTIQSKGLLLPEYSNNPRLTYIIQGRGITGAVIPGCPESFQSFQQSQERQEDEQGEGRQSSRDQHQKIRQFRQGDVIALPAGVAHWCYNDGETPVIAVTVLDTSNYANQLDQNPRKFFLAGNQPREGWHQDERQTREARQGNNIFSGFSLDVLRETFGVNGETAARLQSRDDQRGNIVRVENGLQVVRPQRGQEEEEEREERPRGSGRGNGLEETICNMRLKENIGDPHRADVYNPQGGRITSLNSHKLPILRFLQLSAERGVLHRNAILVPHWNINSHSIIYVTRGRGRVQIVGNRGNTVFNDELRQGQLVIVPQNFAVAKQAGNEGFEWVSFKTNDNAMINPLAGKASTFRGLPEEVLMNSYQISREDARRLKESRREEMVVFSPRFQGRDSE